MKELTKSASLWQEREYIIKGARRCEKINKKRQQIIKYNLLDEVLLRTPATSSAEDKKIAKMFDLYTGYFIISKIVDEHTYINNSSRYRQRARNVPRRPIKTLL